VIPDSHNDLVQSVLPAVMVTLLIVDPQNRHRYLEVRGDVVSIEEDGALEHRAQLDVRYLGPDHVTDPANDQGNRVIVSIKPVKVVAYG
jgi:hypothetical protein